MFRCGVTARWAWWLVCMWMTTGCNRCEEQLESPTVIEGQTWDIESSSGILKGIGQCECSMLPTANETQAKILCGRETKQYPSGLLFEIPFRDGHQEPVPVSYGLDAVATTYKTQAYTYKTKSIEQTYYIFYIKKLKTRSGDGEIINLRVICNNLLSTQVETQS